MGYKFRKAEAGLWIKGSDGDTKRRRKLLNLVRGLPTNETRLHIMALLRDKANEFGHIEEDAALREFQEFTDPDLFWKWKDGDLYLLKKMMRPLGTDPRPGEPDRIEHMDSLEWFRSKMR